MNYNWIKSDYILDKDNIDYLILKVVVQDNDGYRYFYIFNNKKNYSVLYSHVSLIDEFNLIKECMNISIKDKSTTLNKAYDLVVGSDLYNGLFRNKCGVYNLNIDNDKVDKYITDIYKLDLDNIKDNLGLDGLSINIRFIKYNNEICLYGLYGKYKLIKDFISYLLKVE